MLRTKSQFRPLILTRVLLQTPRPRKPLTSYRLSVEMTGLYQKPSLLRVACEPLSVLLRVPAAKTTTSLRLRLRMKPSPTEVMHTTCASLRRRTRLRAGRQHPRLLPRTRKIHLSLRKRLKHLILMMHLARKPQLTMLMRARTQLFPHPKIKMKPQMKTQTKVALLLMHIA